jgi:hypothetical protein
MHYCRAVLSAVPHLGDDRKPANPQIRPFKARLPEADRLPAEL